MVVLWDFECFWYCFVNLTTSLKSGAKHSYKKHKNSNKVFLLNQLSLFQGPFATFNVKPDDGVTAEWTNMSFSPDGRSILVMTNGEMMRLIDAFSGQLLHTLQGHRNDKVNKLFWL